ncbi:hypothetical protein OS493_011373 [Desmophyllum pertusum]|uniref:Uncharacterized protein n=1 Tax=Desmophyllum pertusum TaxID=174260 RepID=A0A9W9Z5J4_9CNID|nr:hypothetical protein OS493_011373 [Desmophyllum pertusum]
MPIGAMLSCGRDMHIYIRLAGIGILGVGIWIMVYKSDYQSLLDSDIYVIVPGLMIAAGVVVLIVGIVGCLGAAKENRFFLISFFSDGDLDFHPGTDDWNSGVCLLH